MKKSELVGSGKAVTRRRRPFRRTVALACALLACPLAGIPAVAEEGGASATRVDGTNAAAPASAPAAYGQRTADATDDTNGTGRTYGAGETSDTDAPAGSAENGGCRNAGTSARTLALSVVRAAFLCLIKAERDSRAAPVVVTDAFLQRSADAHSHDMVVNRFFGHSSSAGGLLLTRVRRAGYLDDARRWQLGETLVRGAGDVTAHSLFMALMGSPAHREVIRDGRYRQVGVGLERGTSVDEGAGLTVTLEFGVITARK